MGGTFYKKWTQNFLLQYLGFFSFFCIVFVFDCLSACLFCLQLKLHGCC